MFIVLNECSYVTWSGLKMVRMDQGLFHLIPLPPVGQSHPSGCTLSLSSLHTSYALEFWRGERERWFFLRSSLISPLFGRWWISDGCLLKMTTSRQEGLFEHVDTPSTRSKVSIDPGSRDDCEITWPNSKELICWVSQIHLCISNISAGSEQTRHFF